MGTSIDLPSRLGSGGDELVAQPLEAVFVYKLVKWEPHIAALFLLGETCTRAILAESP
jgi:hypothetical protein